MPTSRRIASVSPVVTVPGVLVRLEAVDQVYAQWIAAGGSSKAEPTAAEWGGYIAFVADPDGHVWELAHNPYWPLNDDGSIRLPD